jgi:hypothetical protein
MAEGERVREVQRELALLATAVLLCGDDFPAEELRQSLVRGRVSPARRK